jgi:GT2 family glycosyltransferase
MPEVVKENQTGLLFDDIRQLGQYTVDLSKQLHTWAAFQQYGLMWTKAWQDFEAFKGRVAEMLEGKPISPLPNTIQGFPFRQEDVTAVIPTFNNPEVLGRCLASLQTTAPRMKVLVMNNGDPVPVTEGTQVYEVGYNAGFAGAYKLAEPMVDTPLVLWLNDDILAFNPNWLGMMILPFSDPQVGIVGGKLLFPNGALQHAGGAIDWGRPDIGYHPMYGAPDNLDASVTREVPFVTGAAMLMRRELFHVPEELIGGLCYEEAWMSSMALEQGYRTVYQPAACLIHAEGTTRKRTPEDEAKVERNKALFMERWMR